MTTEAKPTVTPARPRLSRRGLNISPIHVFVVLSAVAALSVIINFSNRIQAEKRISAEANQLRMEVTALAATEQALATDLAYVKSDAYVEYWAHTEGRMVRPGEVLVVPVPAQVASLTPVPQPPPPAEPVNNLQIWWELFFTPAS
jgi:cell division protein FtsB